MIIPINKVGNIEIEQNILKFRMPIEEFNTDDILLIEKNLKRKVKEIETDPYYLIPSQIETIYSSVVFYYQLVDYRSFDYLRQLRFKEKLKYYVSLVEIAKRQEKTKVLWNRYNFVVDPLDEKMKAIIFETDNMKIYEKTDSFKGIKDLILISLTRLDEIYGKPSRADFIDQDDYIIQFAETLLKIDNIDDLDDFINTKAIEYEHGVMESSEEGNVNTSNEKKGKNLFPFKFEKKQSKPSPVRTTPKKNKGKEKNSNKMIFLGIGFLIAAIIISTLIPSPAEKTSTGERSQVKTVQTKKDADSSVATTDKKYNHDLLEAYRFSLSGDSSQAVEILEGIGFENLSKIDRKILLNIYQQNNMIYKVIDLDPTRAKEIVNELIANNKTEELPRIKELMETTNPYVDFEVSYLNQDWEKVITLKDEVDLNGRKEQQIIEAYIELEKFEEGEKFAESVGNPDLLEQIKSASKIY